MKVTTIIGDIAITQERRIATQGEAEAGASNSVAMTPLRTAQAIAALIPGAGANLSTNITTLTVTAGGYLQLVTDAAAVFHVGLNSGAAPS